MNGEIMVERIKLLCKEHGIQLKELEEKVGLSKGNISRWKRNVPQNIEVIVEIANILNASVDYILGTDCDENQQQSRGEEVSICQKLIQKTKVKEIEWIKLQTNEIKKIPKLSDKTKYQYSNYDVYKCELADAKFVFSHFTQNLSNIDSEFDLWFILNGEYIEIEFFKTEAEDLLMAISNNKKQSISDLLKNL